MGLTKLAHMAEAEDRHIEIAVFGGSAIVLEWEFRKSTRDIDIVVSQDAAFVRSAARNIAAEMGWPEDWMNDAVK
ncbi:MAG: hypothetical protein HGB17_13860, partial [Syntrophobacteraceae bacterium]|nr:hypothetical protein [Syntrophobacteraceae bacterium]